MFTYFNLKSTLVLLLILITSCTQKSNKDSNKTSNLIKVDTNGKIVDAKTLTAKEGLPFSNDSVREQVVLDFDNRTIQTAPDKSLSFRNLAKNKKNLFIVMSKKDYYLYVYEAQGKDTILIARYDCAFSLKKGQKEKKGDMRTPHCTTNNPFVIQDIVSASNWEHDFGDGRGKIKSYGDYFLRLKTPGHTGIGIHGSTNNRQSVPGRASEGCIRLKDEDIKDLAENYATEGMKVIIKAENIDDLSFEIDAMNKQKIDRLRHFDANKTLTNQQIEHAKVKMGRKKVSSKIEENTKRNNKRRSGDEVKREEVPRKKGVFIGGGE